MFNNRFGAAISLFSPPQEAKKNTENFQRNVNIFYARDR